MMIIVMIMIIMMNIGMMIIIMKISIVEIIDLIDASTSIYKGYISSLDGKLYRSLKDNKDVNQ